MSDPNLQARGRELLKISSRGSRGEEAYEALRAAILDGSLKPSTRLREAELAEWLGISRTPIREALKRLEAEGLVANEPGQGLVVSRLDPPMISELYHIREVLEGTAAALAARHASDGEIEVLREIVNRDKEIADDVRLMNSNNKLLHSTLYSSAHNRFLLKTLQALQGSMSLLGDTTLSIQGRREASIRQHDEIVTAIERRDPDAAEKAARAHIRDAYRIRLRQLHNIGTSAHAALPNQSRSGERP